MRDAIKELLNNNVATINNRTYEPNAAGPSITKPYLVLRAGVQSETDPYKDFTTIYEVWPYTKRTTFRNVDDLSKEVISTLHRKRFDVNGIPHYIEYTGTLTDDVVDEEWDALTRGLRFRVFSLAWLVNTPIEPDPVETMKSWTESNFTTMQTSPTNWDPSNLNPALYWRVANIQGVDPTNWGAWIQATLRGHLILPDIAKRGEWLDKVVRQLALDARTRMSDNSKVTFQSVAADGSYDPFGQGQIQLNVRFGILGKTIELPKMNHIGVDSPGGVIREQGESGE